MITDSDDILTELLLCLPPKSLIRFKLVSKHWLSLISTRHFSHLHTTRHRSSKQKPSLLLRIPKTPHHYYLQLQPTPSKLVPYNFPLALENPTICSSSNGLFLLYFPNAQQDCHVYNPTTRESRKIPFSTNEMYPIVMGLNLVFDPVKSLCYKIICVRFARRRISGLFMITRHRRCRIEVYDSGTCSWKLCGEQFFVPSYMDFDRGIYWNNGIHWGGIFFDFDNNVVGQHPGILVPEGDGRTTFDVNYVELNGCLNCVAHYPGKKLIAVFELQRDYSQWLLKHHIDLDPDFGPLSVLSMVGGNGEEDWELLIHKPGKIMAYEVAEKRFNEVVDFKDEMFYQEKCVQFVAPFTSQFSETLFLV